MEQLPGKQQAPEIEQAILGAAMVYPESVPEIVARLSPESFYDSRNRLVFSGIASLFSNDLPVDLVSVAEDLKKSGKLEECGSYSYLSGLTSKCAAGIIRVEYYCNILIQLQAERDLVDMCVEIMRRSDGTNDIAETLSYADSQLQKINESFTSGNRMEHISLAIGKAVEESVLRTENRRKGRMSGVTSGLRGLDNMTAGFKGGELIILAARPGAGKTSIMLHFAKCAARSGVPVCIYSLEMDSISLADRLILSETSIRADKYRNGYLSNEDFNEMAAAKKTLSALPIYVDDNPVVSMRYIRAHTKKMAKQGKCGMVLVDYLQLADMGEKGKTREQEVAQTSRTAKIIAKELDIPFVLLSQLNRACEERPDKKPMLSDLRESGAIEQDADKVIFVYRPEYYKLKDQSGMPITGEGALIMAKQRNGAVGEVRFRYNESLTQITDIDAPQDSESPF